MPLWGRAPSQLGNTYLRQLELGRSRRDLQQERQRAEQIRIQDKNLQRQSLGSMYEAQGHRAMPPQMTIPDARSHLSYLNTQRKEQAEQLAEEQQTKEEWESFLNGLAFSDERMSNKLRSGPMLSPEEQTYIRGIVSDAVKKGHTRATGMEDFFIKEKYKEGVRAEETTEGRQYQEGLTEETRGYTQQNRLQDNLIKLIPDDYSADKKAGMTAAILEGRYSEIVFPGKSQRAIRLLNKLENELNYALNNGTIEKFEEDEYIRGLTERLQEVDEELYYEFDDLYMEAVQRMRLYERPMTAQPSDKPGLFGQNVIEQGIGDFVRGPAPRRVVSDFQNLYRNIPTIPETAGAINRGLQGINKATTGYEDEFINQWNRGKNVRKR